MAKISNNSINAFLGEGTDYNGKLEFDGAVQIDGRFDGEVTAGKTLMVGVKAYMTGSIQVEELALAGEFEGTVHATKRVILYKTARIKGDIHVPALMVEEGAYIEGDIFMDVETK